MGKELRIAIFGNAFQNEKSASIDHLLTLLRQHDAEISMDKAFYRFLSESTSVSLADVCVIQNDHFAADIAVSMGGDGTFLEAAHRVGSKQIPILGINMGRLGFLSDFAPEEMASVVEMMYSDSLRHESRAVLQVEFTNAATQNYPYALNEVAVLKRDISSMISIDVAINGEHLTTYQADGLIINTPTGSTGYALSVGGPIMSPISRTLGLVPVAPHSLSMRPLTIADDAVVTLDIESRSHNFLVAVDGRSESMQEGTRLTVRRAPYDVVVLKRPDGSFYRTLREKLMWGSDVRK